MGSTSPDKASAKPWEALWDRPGEKFTMWIWRIRLLERVFNI